MSPMKQSLPREGRRAKIMGKCQKKTDNFVFVIGLLLVSGVMAQQAVHPPESSQGGFFAKKEYVPSPLPKFDDLRGQLPSPIFDEKPEWVKMYWKAWELGFRNFNEPKPGS